MRNGYTIALLIVGIIATTALYSQAKAIACEYGECARLHVDETLLDSLYMHAGTSDSTEIAFPGQQEEVVGAEYERFMKGLSISMKHNGWKGTHQMWMHAFFSKEGRLDYLLYSLKGKDKKKGAVDTLKFDAEIVEYAESFQWALKATHQFKQCGTVVFHLGKK